MVWLCCLQAWLCFWLMPWCRQISWAALHLPTMCMTQTTTLRQVTSIVSTRVQTHTTTVNQTATKVLSLHLLCCMYQSSQALRSLSWIRAYLISEYCTVSYNVCHCPSALILWHRPARHSLLSRECLRAHSHIERVTLTACLDCVLHSKPSEQSKR